SRERVQPVGDGLAENQDVRGYAEMLDGPHLAGAVDAHLDLVHNEQNPVPVEHFFQLHKEIQRRDDVTARPFYGLDIECRIFCFARLWVPYAMIFSLEEALELPDAMEAVFFLAHALRPPEMIGEGDELGAVAEMAVAAPVTVARCDGRRAKGAPVI